VEARLAFAAAPTSLGSYCERRKIARYEGRGPGRKAVRSTPRVREAGSLNDLPVILWTPFLPRATWLGAFAARFGDKSSAPNAPTWAGRRLTCALWRQATCGARRIMRGASFCQLAGTKADRLQLCPTCWDGWKEVLIGSVGDPFHSEAVTCFEVRGY